MILWSVEGEYLALSSDSDCATVTSQHNMLTCVFTREHVNFIQHYIPQNICWCPYAMFVYEAQ